jgi:hypothetical protein
MPKVVMKLVGLATVLAAIPARAQSAEESELPPLGAELPPPGAESGRVDEPTDDSAARKAGRALLLVPRGAMEVVMLPIRGTIWANHRYHLSGRLRSWFFNDAGTIGFYPLVFFETSPGVLVGMQLDAKLSEHNRLKLFAGIGPSRRHVDGALRSSGYFDDHVVFKLHGEYDARPESRFYGIGNADEIDVDELDAPLMQLDPFGDAAVKSYYDDRLARAAVIADIHVSGPFNILAATALADRKRSSSSKDPSIETVYEGDGMGTFDDRYRSGYAELELRYDTRGPSTLWQPAGVTSKGSLAAVYAGPVVLDSGQDFWRYGVDAQHYLTIGSGPRVLSARVEVEAVSAQASEVPFTELPSLGGRTWLRGYATDRFRDRVAAVGSLEYQWDLSRLLYASLFVDVGRVYPALDDMTVDDMRVGYGIALEGHSRNNLLARVSMASSIDGGLFFNLYLDPVSAIEPRVRRR